MRRWRTLTAALCAAVLLCGFSVPAYAFAGGEETETTETTGGYDPALEETPEPEPEPNPFTPDGTGTVVDNATDEDGKEFFTITTPSENVFYLVIDRQRSGENVYFLNAVTEADLLALAEISEEPVAPEPTPDPEPAPEPEPEPEKKSNPGTLLLVLALALIGGGAGWYFKVYRPKHQQAPEPEEDYEEELEDYGDYDDPEDDGPPWDEDEEQEDEE